MENTYWDNNGKHQEEADKIDSLMPDFDYTDNEYMNLYIAASKIYHDIYNNGGGNIEDCYTDDFYDRIHPYIKASLSRLQDEKEYLENFMDKVIEFLRDKNLSYTKYVIYQNYDAKQLSKKPLDGFDSISSGNKDYLDGWVNGRINSFHFEMVG